ncbi:MAG: hypothetical protein IPK97_13150 [Ahniella sp.]|nr:hypothetical protein [Ahniella sp.]
MSRNFWMTSSSLVAVFGLVILFFYAFDQVSVVRPVRAKPEAMQNEYLAAMRSLEKMQVVADRVGILEGIGGSSRADVVFIKSDRPSVSPRAIERIRQFVRDGGVLILEAGWYSESDPLSDAFGVNRRQIVYREDEDDEEPADSDFEDGLAETDGESDDADDEAETETETDDEAFVALDYSLQPGRERLRNRHFPDPMLRRLRWDDGAELLVYLPYAQDLSRMRTPAMLADAHGTYGLRFAYGEGRVVVLNNLDFLTNFELARNDHAEFMWRLVQLHAEPKRVLFYHADRQDLGQWLRKHAWAPLWMIGLLVMLLIWRGMPRFGPIADDPEPVRRRLLDHLRASGNFLAKANQREEIGLSALRVALSRVKREYPHLGIAHDTEVRDFLIKQFALPPDCAFLIATTQTPGSVLDWTRLMRACRDIHVALDHEEIRKR